MRVTDAALLRATPGGRAVARIGPRTAFGNRQVLAVAKREGPWLGVLTAHHRALTWIHGSRTTWLPRRRTWIAVDLSARALRVLRGGRTLLRMRVGIGGPASPTPPGRYAVTDRLEGFGPYGCCILALTGRQRRLPAGWSGGDRLAIHGSPGGGIGQAVSGGCLRAGDKDMLRLRRLAPAGTRVRIRT